MSRSPCGSVDRNTFNHPKIKSAIRRSPCGSVDRNFSQVIQRISHTGRSPCGSVDRNVPASAPSLLIFGRSPCGSVDRNKLRFYKLRKRIKVAPLAGAWIEMDCVCECGNHIRSRSPCGSVDRNIATSPESPEPTSRSPCGSVDRNTYTPFPDRLEGVAPLAGAWIEITDILSRSELDKVAPLAGAWIEILVPLISQGCQLRRSPCGSVDRNLSWTILIQWYPSRSPCGSVDRNNPARREQEHQAIVAPLAGAWIEIRDIRPDEGAIIGRSPCGSVDRNKAASAWASVSLVSLPLRERG